jgi:hypothetical protein
MPEEEIKSQLLQAFRQRAKDGWEAAGRRGHEEELHESMARIGG